MPKSISQIGFAVAQMRYVLWGMLSIFILLGVFVSPALASKARLPLGTFCEPTGLGTPPCNPEFAKAEGLAVDLATGNLLVIDKTSGAVSRFKSDGQPDPFSALGSNVIDGKGGEDLTPQNGLFFGGPGEVQVSVAPPSSAAGTAGDIYVTQSSKHLIDIFASTGKYLGQLTEFENASHEGVHFGESCGVAIDSNGAVYVGDFAFGLASPYSNGVVHKFVPTTNPPTTADNDANFTTTERPCTVAAGIGPTAGALFVARYIGGAGNDGSVRKLDSSTGEDLYGQPITSGATTIAVDGTSGNLLAAKGNGVAEFNAAGSSEAFEVGKPNGVASAVEGIAANGTSGDLYVARRSYPNVEVFGPAENQPPTIEAEWNAGAAFHEATVGARFAVEEKETAYHVEYLTQAEFEANGNSFDGPNAPAVAPTSDANVGSARVVSVALTDLQEGTTYRWRFVARNPASDEAGHPTAGPVRSFATFATPGVGNCPNEALRSGVAASLPDCRGYEMVSPVDKNGGNADAFELEGFKPNYDYKGIDQGTSGGNGLTYSVGAAFGGAEGSALINQYLASRSEVADGAGSWSSKPISPPEHGGNSRGVQVLESSPEFKAFSADLHYGWVEPETGYPLAPCATEGYFNLYRRDLQSGQFVALCSADPEPPECPAVYPAPEDFVACGLLPELQGVSEDQQHAIFRVNDKLTGEALPGRVDKQLYEWSEGLRRLVSRLPDGDAYEGDSSAGTEKHTVLPTSGNTATVEHALSTSGTRVYWSTEQRHLFLRLNSDQAQSAFKAPGTAATGLAGTTTLEGGGLTEGSTTVTKVSATSGAFAVGQRIVGEGVAPRTTIAAVGAGTLTLSAPATKSTHAGTQTTLLAYSECSEAEKACTVPVSELVGAGEAQEAQFWDASPDGSRAIFSMLEAGDTVLGPLYEYDLSGEEAKLIAEEGAGVLGASDDLSKVYLAAKEVCGENENSEERTAQAGQPNIYLYEPGESCADKTLTFVGTLRLGDISTGAFGVGAPSPVASVPRAHVARVSPDGAHLAFNSTAQLTGYDNTDANSGAADWEVYLYDAASGASGRLVCASCNPSGARPEGANLQRGEGELWTAAWIPSYQFELYGRRPLSSDGKRLFFNSADPLTPRDTNGAQDVYEWEAPGTGTCTTSRPEYSAQNGGCVSLISTGESEEDSEFVEASTDGRDVFFRTEEGLAPQDPGLIDIYDARAGGGEAPAVGPPACEGDACQSVPPAPGAKTPGSAAFSGPGNLAPHGSCGAYGHRAAKLARRARRLRRHARLVSVPAKARLMRRKSARLTRRAHHLSKHAKRCRRANRRAR